MPQLQSIPGKNTKFLPLSTNLQLETKRSMLYFPTDFGELIIDGLIEKSALKTAISEADLRQIRWLAPQTISNEGPPPDLQIMLANGHLKTPDATVKIQFKVGDNTFKERSTVMTNLISPINGLLFLQRNNTILDMRQAVLNFSLFHATQACRQHGLQH